MSRPTQEQINEGYKQATVQARLRALELSIGVSAAEVDPSGVKKMDIERILSDAGKMEKYLMNEITPPQESNIIKLKN